MHEPGCSHALSLVVAIEIHGLSAFRKRYVQDAFIYHHLYGILQDLAGYIQHFPALFNKDILWHVGVAFSHVVAQHVSYAGSQSSGVIRFHLKDLGNAVHRLEAHMAELIEKPVRISLREGDGCASHQIKDLDNIVV